MSKDWIDVSIPLHNGMVGWPGDCAFRRTLTHSMQGGASNNLSELLTSAHTGTHMDAPLHFVRDGLSIDSMPLEAVIGRARVIGIRDEEAIRPAELEPHSIAAGDRILFRTRNSERDLTRKAFAKDFVSVSPEAARYLAQRGVRLVGVDYLSVGAFQEESGRETHRALLSAGIWIVEGLVLKDIAPGEYDLICLPLRIVGSDGAPARAVLRPAQS
jgi:arylformamidase